MSSSNLPPEPEGTPTVHSIHSLDHAPLSEPQDQPQPQPRRRRRRPKHLVMLGAAAIVATIAGGAGGALVAGGTGGSSGSALSGATASGASLSTAAKGSTAAIAAAVQPSTVELSVKTESGSDTGSGVILTSGGEILTNNHVVSDAANGGGTVTVTFSNGRTASATVSATSPSHDLALVQAKGVSGLKAATLGDSSSVKVGDQVVAIGSPEGLSGTVTSGIVSALDRKVTVAADDGSGSGNGGGFDGELPRGWDRGYGGGNSEGNSSGSGSTVSYKAIQTDAAINPGNSGGPLINADGQVVGINSAMYSDSGSSSTGSSAGSVGLGFSIPINTVKQVVKQMEQQDGAV